jgi:hemerythrin-like domain-containing protein
MDTATKNLENDHVQILRLIVVMEKLVHNVEPKAEHLEMIVGIIKGFADGFHHAKEETLLFPLLVEKGYSSEQGPVAVMLHEHEQGRNYVRAMAESIARYKAGDRAALKQVNESMLGYAGLLRSHIGKENNVLFRMADKTLSEKDQQSLLMQFDRIGKNPESSVLLQDYLRQIEDLEGIYAR